MGIMEMLEQSRVFTLLGIASLFVFFWLLSICLKLTNKISPAPEAKKELIQAKPSQPNISSAPGLTPQIAAAISAAVNEYRKTQSLQ